ncbi:MAG: phosphatidylinositol-3-phosphatase [Acidobacteriota bacterium]|jgi:phospholipase C|nr:phosphatidylinositol-3-phosphatase [Acidobacteriota bacterium]
MTRLSRNGIALFLAWTLSVSAAQASVIQHVIVIAMENHDASQIYGNTTNAPYINGTLIPTYAHATNFNDPLALSIPSEPHYVWMEAGTNAFSDHTFTGDSNPSSTNSTASTAHLVTQIKNSISGVTWMTYQEGQNSTTGSCPIASSGFYAPKHDPFIFFQDVSGNPPSKTNSYCVAHSKPYSSFASDLAANNIASYVFITPNLCNDMHGATGCPNSNTIRSGDDWLKAELPRIIAWANTHSSVIFITWDEGSSTSKMAFLAVGPGVKANFTGTVSYTHSSIIKSVERIFGLSFLSTVSSSNDLADLFQAGFFP